MAAPMTGIQPEFSRPVPTGRLGAEPARFSVSAAPEECRALARRLGILAIDRLAGEVTLRREAGGDIRLDAILDAAVTQSCVVTLEPVEATPTDRFTLLYRAGIDEDEADRLALENPEDETVEPLIGDSIDIGEALAQQLSVVLDPYPRAPGVVPGDEDGESGRLHDERVSENPFDILAMLGKRR